MEKNRTLPFTSIAAVTLASLLAFPAFAEGPLNWEQVRARLLAQNPTLLAGQTAVGEARANEVTAFLRPNPVVDIGGAGLQLFPGTGIYRPLSSVQFSTGVSYLIERQNKRDLRLQSSQLATAGALADKDDLQRNLLFTVRSAFVATLQAKALLALSEEDLRYYDRVISVNQDRYRAGDISELDFQRVEIQRVQFETDVETARLNVRTAKLQLLALLNDRTPVDSFDVSGDFDYKEAILIPAELHQVAEANRADLRSARNAVEKARADHRLAVANGSTDPIVGANYTWNPQLNNPDATSTFGAGVTIPLRIFDRNQGEKARTALEIERTQHMSDALAAGIRRDVDAALENIDTTRKLLRLYHDKYTAESAAIRDKVSFSYSQGNATLLDFLDAQRSYRNTQVAYLGLIGTYLSGLAQLSLATGQEVNP